MEFGFGTSGALQREQISTEPEQESDMVTGDLNAAHVEWVVQYEISDPQQFLFNFREPAPTLWQTHYGPAQNVPPSTTWWHTAPDGRGCWAGPF